MRVAESSGEESLVAAIRRMFARPDYLLPLVAAQRQYREIHYGMTAAALLEDVFTDAVAFYVRQLEPGHTFLRSHRGKSEVDYSWDGLEISHKSGLGPTDVSILWDATVEDAGIWSSEYPIAYLSTGYSPQNGTGVLSNGSAVNFTSMFASKRFPKPRATKTGRLTGRGQAAVLVRWNADSSAEVLLRSEIDYDCSGAADLFSFDEIWKAITQEAAAGRPVNHIETLRTTSVLRPADSAYLEPGSVLNLNFDLRSGLYVMPRDLLRDVQTRKNNRGRLIKAPVLASLMSKSASRGLMVPMPLWYVNYSPTRPPDSFLALRNEFDGRFSSARATQELEAAYQTDAMYED